jgi:predicted ArsR family transcriptional regulator
MVDSPIPVKTPEQTGRGHGNHCVLLSYRGAMEAAPQGGYSDPTKLRAVAALADPSRRALYALVSESAAPVTREEAAETLGISRKLAAFHLDKLVEAGLLAADYPAGSRMRSLGRNPKAYRRSELQVQISIPERRPAALAQLLVDGITTAQPGEPARAAVLRAGEDAGRALGSAVRATARPGRLGAERALTLAATALREQGYQPRRESPTCLRLTNCPFQPLATLATDLVCALNHRMITGLVTGLQPGVATAVLAPQPGHCCVELRANSASGTR